MSGEGQSYLLPISGLDQIVNIDKWSNTDVPGLWIYRSLTLGEDACLNLVAQSVSKHTTLYFGV